MYSHSPGLRDVVWLASHHARLDVLSVCAWLARSAAQTAQSALTLAALSTT